MKDFWKIVRYDNSGTYIVAVPLLGLAVGKMTAVTLGTMSAICIMFTKLGLEEIRQCLELLLGFQSSRIHVGLQSATHGKTLGIERGLNIGIDGNTRQGIWLP